MVKTNILLNKINNRKIIKNLGQFISIIIITFLAVCLAVGLNSSAKTLESKLDYLLDESNFADGIIYGNIQDDDINAIKDLSSEYQKRLHLNSTYKNSSVDLLISDGIPTLNKPMSDVEEEGVYITHDFAKYLKCDIGDTISLSIDISEFKKDLDSGLLFLLSTQVKEGMENIFAKDEVLINLKITGLMYHPEGIVNDTYPISLTKDIFKTSFNNVIKDNYKESIVQTIVTYLDNNVYSLNNSILFKGDYNAINSLEYFKNTHVIVDTQYLNGVLQMNMDIEQAYQLTYVFPVVFIIVSVLIIVTTISQLIFKERLNIATLKSIGISNFNIYKHYILLTISLCMIGGILGAIFGPMFIPNVMSIKYALIYKVPNVSNVYPIIPIIINIFLFVIISTLVSYFILRSSVKMHPASLIKHTGNHKFKTSKIKIKSWNLKIALRNISQNVFRSLMVIVGVGGCAALFITGFGIDDTLNNTVYLDMNVNFNTDATITFTNYSDEIKNEILKYTTEYEEFTIKNTAIESDVFNLTDFYFINKDTKIFNNGNFDGVYISSKITDKLSLKVGDDISFTINSTKYTIQIDYIIETGFTHGVFIPNEYNFDVTNAWLKSDQLEELDKEISNLDGVKDVYTKVEFKRTIDNALGPISIIKITLQTFACLLGVVVLFNLALLNFKEKSRDIATLKVLGLTNREISRSLIYEMMILAILGGLLGLVIGYPLMELLLSINEVEFVTYIYDLSFISYLMTFTFTTLTAFVINIVLFKQINKIKMVESLKSVE